MDQQKISAQLQQLAGGVLSPRKGIYSALLGVAFNDRFEWCGAAGSESGRPASADAPFLIASITKMYTASAVWILQSRGSLQLDEKISRYFPTALVQGLHHYKSSDHTAALTLRHLITHTSGLPDYFLDKPRAGKTVLERLLSEGDRAWTLEDVIQITRDEFPALFPPAGSGGRVKAHYSDTNFKLLGRIIETVTERSLAAVFQELFFDPFDLRHTYLYGHPPAPGLPAPAPVYYQDRAMQLDRLLHSHGPEGGIVSTLEDCLKFSRAYFTGALFEKNGCLPPAQQWNPIFFPFEYGYGLMRFKLPRLFMPFGYSPVLTGHSGSTGSFLYYDRALDLHLAGTTNQMTQRNAPFQLMIKTAQLFRQYA